MSLLTQASLVLTPNAYKANKLYSIIPSSGNGDMVTTRATTATRVNSSGVIENVATGIPRLDYTGSVPSILLEPQRTNLILNSVWVGGGSLPTSWLFSISTGTSIATSSIKNTNVTAYRFVTNTQRQEFYQNTILALNSINTLSVYVESVTTAIPVSQLLRFSATTGTGTSIYLKNNVPILSTENITQGNTYSVQFTCTLADTFQARVGCGVGANVTGDITLSMPQVELGSYATSYIPTTTSTVTRNQDLASVSSVSSLIGQTEGVIFVESAALSNDLTTRAFAISDGTTSNRIIIVYSATSNQIQCFGTSNGVPFTNSIFYNLTDETQFAKIAIRYKVNDITLWVNGAKRGTDITSQALPLSFNRLGFDNGAGSAQYVAKVKSAQLYNTYLTDAEMTSLTTL
jgi:hypothetical protein